MSHMLQRKPSNFVDVRNFFERKDAEPESPENIARRRKNVQHNQYFTQKQSKLPPALLKGTQLSTHRNNLQVQVGGINNLKKQPPLKLNDVQTDEKDNVGKRVPKPIVDVPGIIGKILKGKQTNAKKGSVNKFVRPADEIDAVKEEFVDQEDEQKDETMLDHTRLPTPTLGIQGVTETHEIEFLKEEPRQFRASLYNEQKTNGMENTSVKKELTNEPIDVKVSKDRPFKDLFCTDTVPVKNGDVQVETFRKGDNLNMQLNAERNDNFTNIDQLKMTDEDADNERTRKGDDLNIHVPKDKTGHLTHTNGLRITDMDDQDESSRKGEHLVTQVSETIQDDSTNTDRLKISNGKAQDKKYQTGSNLPTEISETRKDDLTHWLQTTNRDIKHEKTRQKEEFISQVSERGSECRIVTELIDNADEFSDEVVDDDILTSYESETLVKSLLARVHLITTEITKESQTTEIRGKENDGQSTGGPSKYKRKVKLIRYDRYDRSTIDSAISSTSEHSYESAESVNEIEYMTEVYRPWIRHNINVMDVLSELLLAKDDIALIESKNRSSQPEAVDMMLEIMKKSKISGIWQSFIQALENFEYIYLSQLLKNETEIHHSHASAILKLVTNDLAQRICFPEFLDKVYEQELITTEEHGKVDTVFKHEGSEAAARVIIRFVDKHLPNWDIIFAGILKRSSMSDIAGLFEMIEQPRSHEDPKCKQISKERLIRKHSLRHREEENKSEHIQHEHSITEGQKKTVARSIGNEMHAICIAVSETKLDLKTHVNDMKELRNEVMDGIETQNNDMKEFRNEVMDGMKELRNEWTELIKVLKNKP